MKSSISPLTKRISQFLTLVASVGLLSFAGCDNNGGLSTVTGLITLDGNPYPNAQIRFVPTEGRPSTGLTDAEGKYKLHYLREQFGAHPGSYKVDITTAYTSTSDTDGGKKPPEKIPAKYNSKSELTAEVAQGLNEINFELKSKGK